MKIISVSKNCRGFSLLEVMFAVTAFCVATFAILTLVSQSLQNARYLQRPMIDANLVASEISITNQLLEGTSSGDLSDLLGDAYKGYTWSENIVEEQTNKLFNVDIQIQRDGDKSVVSEDKYLFYRPESPAGSLDGATVGK